MHPVNDTVPLAKLPRTSGGALRRLLFWREAVSPTGSRLSAEKINRALNEFQRLSTGQASQLRQLIERHWFARFHSQLLVCVPLLVGVGAGILATIFLGGKFLGSAALSGMVAALVGAFMAGFLRGHANLRKRALYMLAAAEDDQALCTQAVPPLEEYAECRAWRDGALEVRGLLVLDLLAIRKIGYGLRRQKAVRENKERAQESLQKVLRAGA